MTRKRMVMESVMFAAAIYIGYFVFMILQGMVQTQKYVSNLREHEPVQSLQAQVDFGWIETYNGWQVATAIGGFILLGGVYGSIRWLCTKRKVQS